MAKKLNVGVIGCGSIAQHLHIPGYRKTPDVTIAAVCDITKARREWAAEAAPGAHVYDSYEKMLSQEKLDIVSICTPNYLHARHAIAALKSGAHIILEKPAAATMREIAQIRQAAKAARKMVMVGFSHRFSAGPQAAKRAIKEGTLGKPFMIRVRFAHTGPYPGWAQSPWFYDPKQAIGGAMLDMGIHAIDLCNWLIGPVQSVAAQVGTLRKKIRVDDNAVLALQFKGNKALGYIEVGWTSPAGMNGLEIMGDKGYLKVDYAQPAVLVTDRVSPDHKAASKRVETVVAEHPTAGGWSVEIAQIVAAIRKGKDLGIGIDAGGAALAVALAAYQSARTGRTVKL